MGDDFFPGYPKKAIMHVDGHYVLLNFISQNKLEVYDSSNAEKSQDSYPELAAWCVENSVMLTCEKQFIQQPGSTDCGTLSVLNAISLSLDQYFSADGFVNPKSIPTIREEWSLDIARENLIPFVNHRTAVEILADSLVDESRYAPRDMELFHLYVQQEVEAGKSKDNIYEEMKAFCESPEGKRVLAQSDAQSSGQPLLEEGVISDNEGPITHTHTHTHTTACDSDDGRATFIRYGARRRGIDSLDHQVEKATPMRNTYWGFTALTLLVGASISWLAVSLVPLVIFSVISQGIYVLAIKDDYADALGKTGNPLQSGDIELGTGKHLPMLRGDNASADLTLTTNPGG
jgi:hypothetical protein